MKQLGIDLGTSNTIIWQKGRGVVCNQPSVVAVDAGDGRIVAVGAEAKQMLGKTPGSIKAIHPLKDGVIAEFDATADMLRRHFHTINGNAIFTRPRVAICIPYGITEVERRAVQDVTLEAGAQSVALIEEPLAAASGAGMKVAEARGGMIIDLGGGTTEVAVVSLGGIVLSSSARVGGNELDEAIVNYIKRKYSVLIGPATAEELKIKIGSAIPDTDVGSLEIRGRSTVNGLPAVLTVTSGEIREAMQEELIAILDTIRSTLESTPPELASDIFDHGILLTGGLSQLRGLPNLIAQITGIRTGVAKEPMKAVAIGVGMMMDEPSIGSVVKFKNR